MSLLPRTVTAQVRGGLQYPGIQGTVRFTQVAGGTVVETSVSGLPAFSRGADMVGPHGFHLHWGQDCNAGSAIRPFPGVGEVYRRPNQEYGNYAGQFPVLFSNSGRAQMTFFTNQFSVSEAVDKAVIIHKQPDDYRSRPEGNTGQIIACGIARVG